MAERSRVGAIVGLLALVGAIAFVYTLAPRPGAVARGAEVYARVGCAACHGPGGRGGVPNPGSLEREVPALTGGTWMMYVESPEEVREWILDGRPARLDEPAAGPDALLTMPAYRHVLSEQEVDDLVSWYRAAAWYEPEIPPEAAAGRTVARRAGCFGCHGPAGRAGTRNPAALKGYIPGWGSPDFDELVRDDDELRAWILDGVPPRLAGNPVARHFAGRQLISMPAYRDVLEPDQVDSVVAYIRWLRDAG